MRRMRGTKPKIRLPSDSTARVKRALAVVDGLTSASELFISQNIGVEFLERALRRAFARAAAARYKKKNGTVNLAQAAAITGIPRASLRHLLDDRTLIRDLSVQTPIERVSLGWKSDPQFLTTLGAPKVLRFRGQGATFTALVKKYGGDIPPTAVRQTMSDLGLVTCKSEYVALKKFRHRA